MSIDTVNNKKIDLNTGNEIFNQPRVWRKVFDLICEKRSAITDFLSPVLSHPDLRIVLSGAGSSAFLGEAAKSIVAKSTGRATLAIPTTDIVTHPEVLFTNGAPVLLVSFARSGNSPESLEAVTLADEYCENIHHLIITCNKDGHLAGYSNGKTLSLVLPEETNDKSLAMTGSFTSMLLTILLITDMKNFEKMKLILDKMVEQARHIFEYKDLLENIISDDLERVVFLGSGEMLGIARECSLKLQELTDGQVICKHDSFLAFRHGPRAVVNQKTLMVYLFSNNDHVLKYERDLAGNIAEDPRQIRSISVGGLSDPEIPNSVWLSLNTDSEDMFHIIPVTLVGQLLGYYKSLNLGLNPDNPSVTGVISRVVEGVNIYKKEK